MPIDVKDKKTEYFTLKIPKPKNIERILYIIIIIGLLFMLFVHNPFPQFACKNCMAASNDLTASVVEDSSETSVESEGVAVQADAETQTVAEPEPEPKPEPEPEKPKMTALEGEIKYTIVKVGTTIKNKGTDSEYGKITDVTYKIEDNKETVEDMKIKVYAFGPKTPDSEDLERGEITFDIGKGEVREGTIKLKSGSFKNLDLEKTVKLKFFEENKWLKTIEKQVLIK